MNKIFERKGYWIGGTAVALIGVAAVRLIAPETSGVINKAVTVLGYVLSWAGIFLVAWGARKWAVVPETEREEPDARR